MRTLDLVRWAAFLVLLCLIGAIADRPDTSLGRPDTQLRAIEVLGRSPDAGRWNGYLEKWIDIGWDRPGIAAAAWRARWGGRRLPPSRDDELRYDFLASQEGLTNCPVLLQAYTDASRGMDLEYLDAVHRLFHRECAFLDRQLHSEERP